MNSNLKINAFRELWQQSEEQHWLPVHGTSMLPLLHEGDDILVSHDLTNIRRGDILVFQKAEGLIAHRVIRIIHQPGKSNLFLTKGDNCTYFDAPLSEVEILGKVNSVHKNSSIYNFTSTGWQFGNNVLAGCHLLVGTLFQSARQIKHSLHKK